MGVILGLVAGFAGITLISLPTLDTDGNIALGAGFIVLATVFYGISLNIAVPVAAHLRLPRRHVASPVRGSVVHPPLRCGRRG